MVDTNHQQITDAAQSLAGVKQKDAQAKSALWPQDFRRGPPPAATQQPQQLDMHTCDPAAMLKSAKQTSRSSLREVVPSSSRL